MLLAAVGLIRFPDFFTRMHAGSKSAALGVYLFLIGTGTYMFSLETALKCAIIGFVVFLKVPVASQALAKAAFVLGNQIWDRTKIDEASKSLLKVGPGGEGDQGH